MTTNEIYKLAKETTIQQVNNVIADWEAKKDLALNTYNSLVKSGDSPQMALFTAIAEKYKGDNSEFYRLAYEV